MPSDSAQYMIRDLKKGQDVAARLKKATTGSSSLSSSEQLKIVTAVLDEVCAKQFETSDAVFLVAIAALRALVPLLKSKSKSLVDTIATVERYAINYVLLAESRACTEELRTVLSQALHRILDARKSSAPKKRTTAKSRRAAAGQENQDPQRNECKNESVLVQVLEDFLFVGAFSIDLQDLLPKEDSAVVAATVCGALSLRLATMTDVSDLDGIHLLTSNLVVPWIRYLQSFSDKSSQRNSDAYLRRINNFLFDACKKPKQDPRAVLLVRSYALQLEESNLKRFAKDLLYSVNMFTRNEAVRKGKTPVDNVVAIVYEGAMRFASKFDAEDRRWLSEDVSAWIDNILLVYANQGLLSKPVPVVVRRRIDTLKKMGSHPFLLQCFQMQVDLYTSKAYHSSNNNGKNKSAKSKPWNTVHKVLESCDILKHDDLQERPISATDPESFESCEVIEEAGMRCLRLLRILEPLRRKAVTLRSEYGLLPSGAQHLLLSYVRVLENGLHVISQQNANNPGDGTIGEINKRIQKMVGGAAEAANELMLLLWNENENKIFDRLFQLLLQILHAHEVDSPSSAMDWRRWILSSLTSSCKADMTRLAQGPQKTRKESLLHLASKAKRCESAIAIIGNNQKACLSAREMLWNVVHDCHLLTQDWDMVIRASLSRTFLRTEIHLQVPGNANFCLEAEHVLAKDICKKILNGKDLDFLKAYSAQSEIIISALLRYSCWIRRNRTKFKFESDYEETLYALQQARYAVFQGMVEPVENCPLRAAHQQWVEYLCFPNSNIAGPIFSSMEECSFLCEGHDKVLCTCKNIRGEICSAEESSFIRTVVQLCSSVLSEELSEIDRDLGKLALLLSDPVSTSRSIEFLLLSAEILQWLAVALSLRSCGDLASQAHELADICLRSLQIDFDNRVLSQLLNDIPISIEWAMKDCFSEVEKDESLDNSQRLSKALLRAETNLKECLKCFARSEKLHISSLSPNTTHDIAGAVIAIGYHPGLECGQRMLWGIFKLLKCLSMVARLRFTLEDTREAKYYIERCQAIAAESFPSSNITGTKICFLVSLFCAKIEGDSNAIEDMVITAGQKRRKRTIPHGKSAVSYVSSLNLLVASTLFLQFAFPSLKLERKTLLAVLEICKMCEKSLSTSEYGNVSESFRAQTILHKAIANSLLENHMAALNCFQLLQENGKQFDTLRPASLYMLARDILSSTGALEEWLKATEEVPKAGKAPSRRTTRSRAKKKKRDEPTAADPALEEVRDLLQQCIAGANEIFCDVRLSRRIWSLAGILETSCGRSVNILSASTGHGFNARAEYAKRLKQRRLTGSSSSKAESSHAHISRSASSLGISEELIERLSREHIVLIGINFETSKTGLVVWRVCSSGTSIKRIAIPSDGPMSYVGVQSRMSDILARVKASNFVPGTEMTGEEKLNWWTQRHDLDKEMESVLTDIEEKWLKDIALLLIPSLTNDCDSKEKGQNSLNSILNLSRSFCEERKSLTNGVGEEEIESFYIERGNVVLMLDTIAERIPWESLPILQQHHIGATRVPSLKFLEMSLNMERNVDGKSLFYILNPDGDLAKTEARFEEFLSSQYGWNGCIGRSSPEETSAYNMEDIYLFCGHGAGEKHLCPRDTFRRCDAPVALLMGCSSVASNAAKISDSESCGTAIDFLMQGSRAVVGNLWDVSDGDIDRLTASLLEKWLGIGQESSPSTRPSLADAVASAKSACRLPYLTGAACVVMGIPNLVVE